MLTFIDVKFIFDIARLRLFSSANVLQIADAIISPSCYSWNEWNVRHFCFHNQNNSTSSPIWPRRNLAEGGCLVSWFHFTLCRYSLGHVARRNYPGRAS